MTADKPNPGSPEAIQQGCLCAVMDNRHGRGIYNDPKTGEPCFVISQPCPLHGWEEKSDDH